MKRRIDWYKILNIKRKRQDNTKDNLNDENFKSNNIDVEKNIKNPNIAKMGFENALTRLKQMMNSFKVKIPSIINEKSFSFQKILYRKFDNQKSVLKEEVEQNIETNTTKESFIDEKNINRFDYNNYYNNKNVENIPNEESKQENNLFSHLESIDKNCK